MNNEVIPSEPLYLSGRGCDFPSRKLALGILLQALCEPLYPPGRGYDPPSRKLVLGILLQALRDIVSPRRYKWNKGEHWQDDAMEWFDSAENSPGSYFWVCQHLHMDPSRLQGWLNRYRSGDLTEKRRLAQGLVRFQMPSSL